MESMESTSLKVGGQSSFQTELRECRLRRKLGYFNEVAASLERLRDSRENLSTDDQAQIAGEIAWTRLLQGFFKVSYETMDQWMLSRKTNDLANSISRETRAFLELLMEFSRVNCHGDPKKSIEIARIVFDRELQHVGLGDYNYTLVCRPQPSIHISHANSFPDTSGGLLPPYHAVRS